MDIYASAVPCEIFHSAVYLGADHLNLIHFLVFNLFKNYYFKLFNVEKVIGFYGVLTLSCFCLLVTSCDEKCCLLGHVIICSFLFLQWLFTLILLVFMTETVLVHSLYLQPSFLSVVWAVGTYSAQKRKGQ